MRHKIIMLAILLVSLLAVSTVNATDNVTSDFVGVDTTDEVVNVSADGINGLVEASENQNDKIIRSVDTNEIISSTEINLNDVNIVYDDEVVEIDVLENAVSTDKNTIYINTSSIANGWSYNNYYFDYNDKYIGDGASDYYTFNLNLTPNTKYDYEFLGKDYISGHNHYRPWESASGYQSSIMFKGTFETDDNGHICNFTHNQHYKFVFRINGQIDFYGEDSGSYALNHVWAVKNRLLKGSNLISLHVLSMVYNFNVFRPYTMFKGNTPIGTFSDLNDRLNTGFSEIIFDCDYIYNSKTDSEFINGITIKDKYKPITIDGKGHVIDGNAQSKIFQITGDNVILKNITFTNILSSSSNTKGAIYWSGYGGVLESCKFINISVNYGVGAIKTYCGGFKINNCVFNYNYAKDSIIYLSGGKAIINNCTFNNNINVISIDSSVKNSEISNCLFINNDGGSIINSGVEGMMINCSFINNSNNEGGALLVKGNGNILFNSLFINNTASNMGGAIFWSGAEGVMNNCTFINNSASNSSGAVSWTGEYGTIDNCIFINNTPISSFSDTSRVFKKQLNLNSSNYEFNYKHLEPISIIINNMSDNLQVTDSIIFKLNNGIKTINISEYAVNGIICLFDKISALDVGNWTVFAIFEGDDNYYPCNTTFIVTINPTVSFLTFDKISSVYGKQISLTVNAHDIYNSMINEGTVVFFDGENKIGEAIVTNGVATLTYTPSTAGKHFIKAFYHADNYVNSTNSTQLNVDKANPLITINTGDAIEDSDLIIDVDIAGATGKALINGDQFSLINNKASKTISNLLVGELLIEVVYLGDDNYQNSTKSTKITVLPKQNPDLDATVKDIEVGQTATINIVINEKVTGNVTINDKKIQIDSGKGSYDIRGLSEGNYTYIVKFEGDKYFNKSNKTVSLKVSKVRLPENKNPFIPTKNPDATQSNNPSYTLTLGSDATGTLTVTIGNKTFTKELVDGTATVDVNGVPAGDYVVNIAYSGDAKYASITRTVNATVKVDPVITASNVKVTYVAGSYYTIKVYGKDGKLANGAIVKISGRISKTLKTTRGIAKFKITQVPGTYKITINALGKKVIRTITVKHLVTLKTVTFKKSAKKLTLQAALGKVRGKYLKKKTITFKINGNKMAIAKTNNRGIAKIVINNPIWLKMLKVGKKVTYQATYLKDTVKKTAKIQR